jgi:hypothetical protein
MLTTRSFEKPNPKGCAAQFKSLSHPPKWQGGPHLRLADYKAKWTLRSLFPERNFGPRKSDSTCPVSAFIRRVDYFRLRRNPVTILVRPHLALTHVQREKRPTREDL